MNGCHFIVSNLKKGYNDEMIQEIIEGIRKIAMNRAKIVHSEIIY